MTPKDPKLHIVDTLGTAAASRFTRLHDHVEGKTGPPLRADFAEHLDRVCGQGDEYASPDALADIDEEMKEAALARLQVEHARLYGVLFLTDIRKLSLRETGRCLKMSHPTVGKHRDTALAKVRAWCVDNGSIVP